MNDSMLDVRERGNVESTPDASPGGERTGEAAILRRSRSRNDAKQRSRSDNNLNSIRNGEREGIVSASANEGSIRYLTTEIARLQEMLAQAVAKMTMMAQEIETLRERDAGDTEKGV